MIRMKQILCAADFSEFSRRALDHALSVARCYGSTVTALHVVAPTPVVVPAPYYIGTETPPVALPQTDHAVVAAEVQRLIDEEDVAGVRVDTRVEEAPTVHGEILVQAERLGSDLIVMGHTAPC